MPQLDASLLRFGALATALSLCAGCAKPLNEEECDQLLDHYTARLLHNEHPDVSPALISVKQQQAKVLAKRSAVYEYATCADKVSRQQLKCALATANLDEIERCLM